MNRLAIASFVSLAALACPAAAQDRIQLSIGTGGSGGVYYSLGGGIANVLSKYVPGMQATAEVTGGAVDNLRLVATGKPYLGLSMADVGQDAFRGTGRFKAGRVPLRTLMILHMNHMHVVTVEGAGINKIADLRGKRVSTGSPGSATEVMAFRILQAAGLSPTRDMMRERLGVEASVNAVKDRRIDAFFWGGGLPTAAVADLAATPGIRIKLIDHADYVDAMNKKFGNLYLRDVIPQSTYAGMTADNQQASVANILVAHEKMSDQVAYDIVKTIFARRDDLIAVHSAATELRLDTQRASGTPVPYHPGAVKFFQERGVRINN